LCNQHIRNVNEYRQDHVRSTKLICHELTFHENMPQLPYPNFYHEREDLVTSYAPLITYSVHQSSIIIDMSPRSAHSASCRHVG